MSLKHPICRWYVFVLALFVVATGGGKGFAGPPVAARLDPHTFVDAVAHGADPTGVRDSTDALQAAIRESVEQQKVCYLRPGTYRISRTLRIVLDGEGGGDFNVEAAILMGGVPKPTIVLAPHARLESSQYVIHFWSRKWRYRKRDWDGDGDVDRDDRWATPYHPDHEQPNTLYNTKMINLRVRVEKGNPGATAVRMRGAQGTGVQDVDIELLEDDAVGLSGGCGSGGGHFNVQVTGGRIGLDLTDAQPAPTIAGVTLLDQSEAAILYKGRQTLTAVGCEVRSARSAGPLIRSGGAMSLLDTTIDFPVERDTNVAIVTSGTLYLRNVFVRGARTLVQARSGERSMTLLSSPRSGWVRVRQYARAQHVSTPYFHAPSQNYYSHPVYVNGSRLSSDFTEPLSNEPPPSGLRAKHVWKDFPTWEQGVVPAGMDSDAIQKAIDSHRGGVVFLPKGIYTIKKTLFLYRDTTLIGAGRHLTVLRPAPGFDRQPLIETEEVAQASTRLAFLKLEFHNAVGPRAYALSWRCGGDAMVRSVNFQSRYTGGAALEAPFVVISGHGGGRWYEFFNTNSAFNQGLGYRHLLIRDAQGPLRFYQCNPEHAIPGGRTNEGVKNVPQIEVVRSQFITFYGLKGEGNNPLLWVRDSDHVIVSGTGGNASAMPDQSLFLFQNVPNWLCANAMDSPRPTNSNYLKFSGAAVDPSRWSIIRERQGMTVIDTQREDPPRAGADRPVLVLRGMPRSEPSSAL
ncbi:MAG: glycoside hydrolase family 55 protein [Abditibacteriales bacterium]|nr:glycoside hydrolase family 55 protein [Abditibacteriales bacterium]MDW8365038.1 glycosyl hydrolase family 28-related protein [Abditibacteriales bacterium]